MATFWRLRTDSMIARSMRKRPGTATCCGRGGVRLEAKARHSRSLKQQHANKSPSNDEPSADIQVVAVGSACLRTTGTCPTADRHATENRADGDGIGESLLQWLPQGTASQRHAEERLAARRARHGGHGRFKSRP